jgi:protein-disulfide isomerase
VLFIRAQRRSKSRAEQDMADANAVKVVQTPTFYINGKALSEYTLEKLRSQVQQEIAAQYP